MGRSVELHKQKNINNSVNPKDIEMIFNHPNKKAAITYETQMMLFTAEGILRAESRGTERGIVHIPSVIYSAYKRWLSTQGYTIPKDKEWLLNGWLFTVKELHVQRAPVHNCLSALFNNQNDLLEKKMKEDNKRCFGITRVSPIGLFHSKEDAFTISVDCAKITTANFSSHISVGTFAYLIATIVEGHDLDNAVLKSIKYSYSSNRGLLRKAYQLAISDEKPNDAIKELGESKVDEEALAIGIYCALKYKNDFLMGVKTAIIHDGNRKGIAFIAGNILGAYLGVSKMPDKWINQVEINHIITQVADDLLTKYRDDDEWWARYPGS